MKCFHALAGVSWRGGRCVMLGRRPLSLRLHGAATWAGGWHASSAATPPPPGSPLSGDATGPGRPSRPTRSAAALPVLDICKCGRVVSLEQRVHHWNHGVLLSNLRGAQANRRAVIIQAAVRGYLTRSSFRKATELGKRQAARAALQAKRNGAAVVIQKHIRRRAATKRVCFQAAWHILKN